MDGAKPAKLCLLDNFVLALRPGIVAQHPHHLSGAHMNSFDGCLLKSAFHTYRL
jgi:hypothetical protein